MQIVYDGAADALYIQFRDQPVARSQRVSPACAVDFDSSGDVIGLELLHVRKSGIDPFALDYRQLMAAADSSVAP